MNWEIREESIAWVRAQADEFKKVKTELTFAEWCYRQGIKDTYTKIIMYLNDAAFAQNEAEEECAICIRRLMRIIEDMEGKDINVPTKKEGKQNEYK